MARESPGCFSEGYPAVPYKGNPALALICFRYWGSLVTPLTFQLNAAHMILEADPIS